MDQSRRSFLQMSGLALATSLVPRFANGMSWDPSIHFNPSVNDNAWPIIQGPTDAHSTSFVVLHPQNVEFSFRVGSLTKYQAKIDNWSLPGSKLAITEYFVSGLMPNVEYRLNLLDENDQVFDQRFFKTLDVKKLQCRFALASCMYDHVPLLANPMWKKLYEENCDFVVLIGDTCYSDIHNSAKDEAGYARRYAETRLSIPFFKMPRLVPIFATWDDHDFGLDNGDRTFPLKNFNKQLFRRFWGNGQNIAWSQAVGAGGVFKGFGQRFYLLDDRTDRDPSGTPKGRHWGKNQSEWLMADLESSKEPAWLLNGSQFFGGYLGKESVEGDHPGDLQDITHRLSKIAAPVVFGSGDVHFSEVMKIEAKQLGYETREFTSSSLHSTTFPGTDQKKHNPRRLVSEWRYNFMVLETNVQNGWQIHSQCMTADRVSFEQNFSVIR